MFGRFIFPAIVVFWVVMNALLIRSEYGARHRMGGSVPVDIVWNKILTAPDDSGMEITRKGEKIGYCRWRPNVGEALATGKIAGASDEFQPEGRVRQLAGYTIDFEGNLMLNPQSGRLRLEMHGEFDAADAWRNLSARIHSKAADLEISAAAGEEKIRVKFGTGENAWQQELSFADARDPQALAQRFGAGPFLALLPQLGALPQSPGPVSLGLNWEASNDWLRIGSSRVRVYRLEARLFGQYKAVVIVSRVGEILKVELPNDIRLLNEALTTI